MKNKSLNSSCLAVTFIITVLIFNSNIILSQKICTFHGENGNNWGNQSNWSCGYEDGPPSGCDQAIIPSGKTVNVNISTTIGRLTNNGTIIIDNGKTLTIGKCGNPNCPATGKSIICGKDKEGGIGSLTGDGTLVFNCCSKKESEQLGFYKNQKAKFNINIRAQIINCKKPPEFCGCNFYPGNNPPADPPASFYLPYLQRPVKWGEKMVDNDCYGHSSIWYFDETIKSNKTHCCPPTLNCTALNDSNRLMNGWTAPASPDEDIIPWKGYNFMWKSHLNYEFWLTNENIEDLINFPVTYTNSGKPLSDGWNFLSNAFICPIDWEAASGWTKTNINNAVYIWDGCNKRYQSYVNGQSTNGGSNIIPMLTGFWVKASDVNPVLTATYVIQDSTFGDKKKKNDDAMRIRLMAYYSATDSLTDETIVYFDKNATVGFDGDYDAYNMFHDPADVPDIYTKSNNIALAIDAIPNLTEDAEIIIPVGYIANEEKKEKYVIKAAEINNLPLGIAVFLEDKKESVFRDLALNPTYKFYYKAADADNRFFLHLALNPTSVNNLKSKADYSCYAVNNDLFIDYKGNDATLEVYNLAGQQIIKPHSINAGNYKYTLSPGKGLYFVRLKSSDNVFVKKILIGN